MGHPEYNSNHQSFSYKSRSLPSVPLVISLCISLSLVPLSSSCFCVEYAEALTNPIKHLSLLVQRERQLLALMEDPTEVSYPFRLYLRQVSMI